MTDFTAATWNVYHGTDLAVLNPILRRLRHDGVSIFLIQEGQRDGLPALLAKRGLVPFRGGVECLVAYDPEVWELRRSRVVALSPTTYFRKGGKPVPLMTSPVVRLRHRKSGKVLKALSYHTPSAVQRGGEENENAPARLAVTENAMRVLRRIASRSKVAVLAGGDDNFDERLGFWRELTQGFTGLEVVQAPTGTHGSLRRGRRIDDFRTKGLRARSGYTIPGGGDHRVHVRRFDWR